VGPVAQMLRKYVCLGWVANLRLRESSNCRVITSAMLYGVQGHCLLLLLNVITEILVLINIYIYIHIYKGILTL
jgi:hypothetical protein